MGAAIVGPAIKEFADTFVDPELCHSQSTAADLERVEESLRGIGILYHRLDKFATDGWSRDEAEQLLGQLDLPALEAENYRWKRFYSKEMQRRALERQRIELLRQYGQDLIAYAKGEAPLPTPNCRF